MPKVSQNGKPGKPTKPKDCPLWLHPSGYWCRKIRGKSHYFGKDLEAALKRWAAERDDLLAGRTPRTQSDSLTVRELANLFLTFKQHAVDAGELTQRSFNEYYSACDTMTKAFGLGRYVVDLAAADFDSLRAKLAKRVGPVRLGKLVQLIRTTFKYGYDAGLIDRPVRFGPGFKRPGKRVLRTLSQKQGPKMFEADQIRRLIDAAPVQLKAMILLACNCGYGNGDCGKLERRHLDLKAGWAEFPRPKTAVERRCPLWPETIEALQVVLAARPEPKLPEHSDLVFVTRCGDSWAKATMDNPVAKEFTKLMDRLKLKRRKGVGFYALRHVFETIGGGSRDQVAVDYIMGHSDPSMAANYRQRIEDERLVAVTDHVHAWLFGDLQSK